jgi:hypothetical protein
MHKERKLVMDQRFKFMMNKVHQEIAAKIINELEQESFRLFTGGLEIHSPITYKNDDKVIDGGKTTIHPIEEEEAKLLTEGEKYGESKLEKAIPFITRYLALEDLKEKK